MEKKQQYHHLQKDLENQRRNNGRGRLTDEKLSQLVPSNVEEFEENNAEIGTFCIQTNHKDLNAEQVYLVYKQRQAIEEFFKE